MMTMMIMMMLMMMMWKDDADGALDPWSCLLKISQTVFCIITKISGSHHLTITHILSYFGTRSHV